MDLCHSTDAFGVSMLNPNVESLHDLLDSLEDDDINAAEHPDVSLTNDTLGWSISFSPSGIVTLESLDEPEISPRYLLNQTRNQTLALWLQLKEGRIDHLLAKPWQSS